MELILIIVVVVLLLGGGGWLGSATRPLVKLTDDEGVLIRLS